MRLIYGTIVVRKKAKVEKEDKVCGLRHFIVLAAHPFLA